ncbi:MAG: alpha/beta fold hydrolase [Candidatus Heimdallarchaeota archaeon]
MTTQRKNDKVILKTEKSKKHTDDLKDYSPYLTMSEEQVQKIELKMEELVQDVAPKYLEEPISKAHWIPVDGGEIRVLHTKPKNPVGIRPVVFISGWQTMPYQFDDLYNILYDRVEIYYIETREKSSSRIRRRKADLSLSQKAKDVQVVLEYFRLQDKDFVLFGTCWGAAIVYQGLLDGVLKAPTIATFSPMHKLWFNKFILKYLIPFTPSFFITFLMRTLAHVIFIGEKAETQKNRMQLTMKEGVAWKWKKAARAAVQFELFGKLSTIKEEILVISGTHDRVHKGNDYPRFAEELPNGRFFHFGIDESERERILGVLIHELALTSSKQTPVLFEFFEREIV